MPKLRRRKDGGYFVRRSGDSNSVNTFQITDEGAGIVESSGRGPGDFFPDQLFFLLYDLGHLSTKGSERTKSSVSEISNIEWATDELSVEERVSVACQITDKHGVGQLLEGDTARWILTLTGEPPVLLKPLVEKIANASGYSYETIVEYSDIIGSTSELLETALCAHLQMEGMRNEVFDSDYAEQTDWTILGTDSDFVYLNTTQTATQPFGVVGEVPDHVPDELRAKLDPVWGPGVGTGGLAVLASSEIERQYGADNGIVLPRERLEDFPVDLPPRSELTEQYEALRLLQNNISHVLSSPETGVEHGDGSYCDRWYRQVHERLVGEDSETDSLGTQQRERLDFTVQTYRDCYGDGDKITDFAYVEQIPPNESEEVRLFGLGIFDHSETVLVPASPISEEALPIYPKSKAEFEHAVELLNEFPDWPSTNVSS